MQYEVEVNGRVRQVNVHRTDGRFVASVDGKEWSIDAVRVDALTMSLLIEEPPLTSETPAAGGPQTTTPVPAVRSHEVTLTADPAAGHIAVRVGAVPLTATLNGRRRWGKRDDAAGSGSGAHRIVAPMPGKVLRILVSAGESVTQKQPLIVIEAMKMENELRAPAAGIVTELHAQEGQSVDAGTLLAVIGPA